jgi:hypothetical protein
VYLDSGCTEEHGLVWGAVLVAAASEWIAGELCDLYGADDSSAAALDPDQYGEANAAVWECVRPDD